MIRDFFLITFKSIRYRPVRSWLTMLGIVIGIMLVVVILSLGNGIENVVNKTLQMFGTDLLIIYPGKETNPVAGLFGGVRFNEKDILDLVKIPGIDYVVPVDMATVNIDFMGEKKSVMVHGAPWAGISRVFKEARGVKTTEGAWPTQTDTPEIVIGHLVAEQLFKTPLHVGDEIIIKSKVMMVAAILSEIGQKEDDNSVYMSLPVLHRIMGSPAKVISAMVRALPGNNIGLLAEQVRFQLHKQDEVRDFSVLTPATVSRVVGSIISIVEFFLMTIAMVSLLVGAIGIMNTMYTAVLERTKQIGIIKAIGASSDIIMTMFLIESGIIGFIGGILGIVFGVASAAAISMAASIYGGINGLFSFGSLDYMGLAAVLVLTFIVGIVAGYLPARQASKMEPAEALRYE